MLYAQDVGALEDKIVQRAAVSVLNAIYEEDFLGFSYGFRPGRGAHDALDALSTAIDRDKVNFIVDADIAKFFDTVSHEWLVRFLEHRNRVASANRARRGLGKPETFDFLGFTFICGKSRNGGFLLKRKSRGDRMRAKLKAIKEGLKARMHQPIPVQGQWLGRVVAGWLNYHAVPTNSRALSAFRHHVVDLWRRSLRRRSQTDRTTWTRVDALANVWLPKPRILHPWPEKRFAVTHPRWEPDALIGPVRFCAGGAQ